MQDEERLTLKEVWDPLEETINSMLDDSSVGVSKEVYSVHVSRVSRFLSGYMGNNMHNGSEMYEKLSQLLRRRMSQLAVEHADLMGLNLLSLYCRRWEDFVGAIKPINNILSYMNRYWVTRQRDYRKLNRPMVSEEALTVKELGLRTWSAHFFKFVGVRVLNVVHSEVARERAGEAVDSRDLMRLAVMSTVKMEFFTEDDKTKDENLELYKSMFETPFIEKLSDHYSAESAAFLQDNTVADYVQKVISRLAEEEERVNAIMHRSTLEQALSVCENVLIVDKLPFLIEAFDTMLAEDKQEDMNRLYHVLRRKGVPDGLKEPQRRFRDYIRVEGEAKLAEVESNTKAQKKGRSEHKQYVEALIGVYVRYHKMVVTTFEDDFEFQQALSQAFKHLLNERCNRSAEFLSLYIDDRLSNSKGVSEAEAEEVIDNCLALFQFLSNRDEFQKYYMDHLAKRLLRDRNDSDDAESAVIYKLKRECGTVFTHKLENMFKDIQLSRDTMTRFRESEYAASVGFDLNVQVCTTGNWPSVTVPVISIPDELQKALSSFEKYYLATSKGRILHWQTALGTVEMEATYGTKRHLISLSPIQMCVLLMFNDRDQLSWQEILDAVAPQGLEDTAAFTARLKIELLAVSCAKYVLLKKAPKSRKITTADVFTYNAGFKCKKYKFKISQIVKKETDEEKAKTMDTVEADRTLALDAAIVRVLKTNKTMTHNDLVAEVIVQVQSLFSPQVALIKQQIEKLIERNYIERDEDDRRRYNYVA